MNSRKGSTGINAGSSSILVIFVLLCLTTFATLALVSANADNKLTQKTAESTILYYKADSKAEEELAQIASQLEQVATQAKDEADYQRLCAKTLPKEVSVEAGSAGLTISYVVPVGARRELVVELLSQYQKAKEGKQYSLTKWQTRPAQEWKPNEDGLQVWDGKSPI